jgi:hypothetical protein
MIGLLEGAAGAVFFTGGDLLRISRQIGDTEIERRVRAIFDAGGVIAGTSAGASVMSDTMLVKGTSGESYRIGDLHMAPGLGLLRDPSSTSTSPSAAASDGSWERSLTTRACWASASTRTRPSWSRARDSG